MATEFWVNVHFPDGRPDGLRAATRDITVGRVLGFSRRLFEETRKDGQWNQPSVYVLRGPGEGSSRPRIYVGRADVLGRRLDDHLKDPKKAFWSESAAITSSVPDRYAVPLKYIEARLIEAAIAAERATVKQNVETIPHLPPSDRSKADLFLEDALLCLRALGFAEFEAGPDYPVFTSDTHDKAEPPDRATHHLVNKPLGIRAWAKWDGQGPITVLEGSQVAPTERGNYRKERSESREQLRKSGKISHDWVFAKNVKFDTDQEAKQIVLGSNGQKVSGWIPITDLDL